MKLKITQFADKAYIDIYNDEVLIYRLVATLRDTQGRWHLRATAINMRYEVHANFYEKEILHTIKSDPRIVID